MFADNFKKLAIDNNNFRKVLETNEHSQIVAMSLPVGSDIGEETHPDNDQLFLIAEGRIEAKVDEHMRVLEEGSILAVPAGTLHNISNAGDITVKLLTIYAPAHHPEGTVQATKEEAVVAS
jgi:mannose-6-phosphate isomerase-like protein (cupin superfamily)